MEAITADRAGRTLDGEISATYRVMLAILAVSLLAAGGAGAYVLFVSQPKVVSLTASARSVRLAHEAMLDQETGLRGFLATGSVEFLGPYNSGRERLEAQERALIPRLSEHPDLIELALDTRSRRDEWIAFAEDARSQGSVLAEPAELIEVFERGKTLFDPYRAAQSALSEKVVRLRDDAIAQQEGLMIAVLLAQIASVVGTLVVFRRRMQRLMQLIVVPVQQVREAMQRVQAGDVGVRTEPAGLPELREVGEGFNEMAAAIDEQTGLAERRETELVQHTGSLTEILRLSREIAGNLNMRYVQEAVASACLAVSEADVIIIYLVEDEGQTLVASHDSRGPGARLQGPTVGLGQGPIGEAAALARRATSVDSRTVALPMVVGARVIGVLSFTDHEPIHLSDRSLEVLETLATHSATAIEAARLHETTKELSTIDALTRLPNRRRFDDELKLEVERAIRYERPLALIMLDVDHFKSLNDSFGHQAGDEVLQVLAQLMGQSLRGSDTAYRYGGEEFAVLLRETPIPEALQVAERIRASTERRFAGWNKDRSITASLGVADIRDAAEPELLVASADKALYRAKAEGRNRIVSSTTEPAPETRSRGHVRPVG